MPKPARGDKYGRPGLEYGAAGWTIVRLAGIPGLGGSGGKAGRSGEYRAVAPADTAPPSRSFACAGPGRAELAPVTGRNGIDVHRPGREPFGTGAFRRNDTDPGTRRVPALEPTT